MYSTVLQRETQRADLLNDFPVAPSTRLSNTKLYDDPTSPTWPRLDAWVNEARVVLWQAL